MTEASPFVCNMNALSPEQRARHNELEHLLQAALLETHELSNGYDFQFRSDPEIYDALSRITPLEHACCPFFDISIVLRQDGKLVWRLTGKEGVKQFIRQEFE